jgi:hypothetical protein
MVTISAVQTETNFFLRIEIIYFSDGQEMWSRSSESDKYVCLFITVTHWHESLSVEMCNIFIETEHLNVQFTELFGEYSFRRRTI